MQKHKHHLEVTREEDFECFGCDAVGKVTCISSDQGRSYVFRTMNLCNKCLSWLKGRLKGF